MVSPGHHLWQVLGLAATTISLLLRRGLLSQSCLAKRLDRLLLKLGHALILCKLRHAITFHRSLLHNHRVELSQRRVRKARTRRRLTLRFIRHHACRSVRGVDRGDQEALVRQVLLVSNQFGVKDLGCDASGSLVILKGQRNSIGVITIEETLV